MDWQNDKKITFDVLYDLTFRENPAQMRKSGKGWKDLGTMLDTLIGNLNNYRTQIARDWDSEAGRKFVEKVDEVLGSMRAAKLAADANGNVLGKAADNADTAFRKMNAIKKRWDSDVARWNDREHKDGFFDTLDDWGGDLFGDTEDLEKYRKEGVQVLRDLDGDYRASDSAFNTSTGIPEYKGPTVAVPFALPPGITGPGRVPPPGTTFRKTPPPQTPPRKVTPPVQPPPVVPKPEGRVIGPKLTGTTTSTPPKTTTTPPTGIIRPPAVTPPVVAPPPSIGARPPVLSGPGGGVTPPKSGGQPTAPHGPGQSSRPGTPPTGPGGSGGPKSGNPTGAPPQAGRKTTKPGPKDPLAHDEGRRPGGTPPSVGGGGRKQGKPGQPDNPHGTGPRQGTLGTPPSARGPGKGAPPEHDAEGLKRGMSGRATPPSVSGRPGKPGHAPDLEHDAIGRRGSNPVIGSAPKPGWGFRSQETPETDEFTSRRPGAAAKGAASPVLGGNEAKRRQAEAQDDLLPRHRRQDEAFADDFAEYAAPPVIETPDEVRHGTDERGPVLGQGR